MTKNLMATVPSQIRAVSGHPAEASTQMEVWQGLSSAVVDAIADDWYATTRAYQAGRMEHYFSAEFLMGRALLNNLTNLGLVDEARETGLPVRLEVSGGLDLPAGLGLTVYRTVQEGLSNARRHAGAPGRVEVRVNSGPEDLVVEVLDDGDGLSASAGSSGSPGHGLVGMRERVASHGGALETGPRADGGFRVRAVLPIRNGEP